MAPRGKKKTASPRKQISIKGFFTPAKKRKAEEEEQQQPALKKEKDSPKKKKKTQELSKDDPPADATNNNNNEESENTNNNNNNNNNEVVKEDKKKEISKKRDRKAKEKVLEKDIDDDDDDLLEDVDDDDRDAHYLPSDEEDIDDPMSDRDEDDPLCVPDPDSPSKETFILRAQSPAPKDPAVKFKCKVCDEWFPNRYFQRKHMLMEHENQRYECRVCNFHSVDPEKLKSHIIKQHVTKKERNSDSVSLNVSLDAIQVDLDELITKHTPRKVIMEDGVALGRDANNKMRFICAICERIYTSKYSLERHVRCHTGEKPYSCDVCDFSTSYREHMQRHMTSVHLIVHSDEPKLKYVPKNRKKTEEKNVSTEDIDEPIEETEANDSFNSNEGSVLSTETSSSSGKKRRNILRKRFECAACGMKATHKTDLIAHIKDKHPKAHIESLKNGDGSKVHLIVTVSKKASSSKRMSITCPDCSKVFHDTWKYKIHMRSHTGVKPFGCNKCSFFANRKMTVRDHIHRKHPEAKDSKILLRTVQIDGTVEHVELDVPRKEFVCDICKKKFDDNYHMKQHKKKEHKESLPFSCGDCGHKESAKAALIMHCMEKHSGEELKGLVLKNNKPLTVGVHKLPKCDHCDKVFAYQSQLYIHQKQHTGERSLFCDMCNFSTNHKIALSKHIQKHMDGEEPQQKRKSTGRKKGSKSKDKDEEPINFVDVGVKAEKGKTN